MLEKPPRYQAYLLRCWEERGQGPEHRIGWRFSLEEVGGERRRRGFGDLEALVTFLRAELSDISAEEESTGEQTD